MELMTSAEHLTFEIVDAQVRDDMLTRPTFRRPPMWI